jgi:hypothetical protein
MVNRGMVNGGAFASFPAGKRVPYRVFPYYSGFQKVR